MEKKSIICSMVKNEQLFIKEWVKHHLSIGFDKIYIFEDFTSGSHKEQLNEFIEKGKVSIIRIEDIKDMVNGAKGTHIQFNLFKWFLEQCKNGKIDADWVGFFDVDEFLMFEKGWGLKRLENAFKDYGGVLLSWLIYGADGHLSRPKGNVVDNYTSHLPKNTYFDDFTQWNHKSLVNVSKCSGIITIHTFKGCVHTDGNADYEKSPQVYGKAWINHYYTKSWEDYKDRMLARGNLNNNGRCFDLFFLASPEFADKKEEMINEIRQEKTNGTMWISHDMKIISGGNEKRIEELRKKYIK